MSAHDSKLSKPVRLKSIRIRSIYFNSCFRYWKCPRCGKRDKSLSGRVMGCCSLERAGEQVCAASIVIHFQPAATRVVKY